MDTKQTDETFLKVLGIAILGTILLIVTNGMTYSGITIFDEAILSDFGWTKSELKLRDLINMVAASVILPFLGAVIDKYGVKKMMVLGLVLLAAMYYLYSYIQSAWHIYGIHLLLAFAVSGAGTLATVIMVSQRVVKRRGLALGIALAGTSLGGIIIPQIARPLLENYGWRAAFQFEAIIPLIVMVVLLIFIKPIKYTKKADDKAVKDEETGLVELSFSAAIKSPVFWAISFAGVFCFYSILGIISNLFLHLREMDFSVKYASNALSIFFAIILVAKLASGAIAELINEHRLFKIQLAMMTLGTVGLAIGTPALVWPSLVAVGLGWGGLYTLFNYIIITTFGVKSAGKIGGAISFFEGVGSGLGMWLTAYISDQTGSYNASFWLIVVLLTIAFVISFFIKPIVSKETTEVVQ
ncbi:MFS transporter [Maribacter algarum]|uniref:MFS transporter n=1 Tax=Maribacter algarum (ex Zhang et al. 2020) TaxID=2578118 RepID=A0A5S3PUD2_9FLAO|nr:MFS transporter [Maribacter algarum]TMM58611.1 MFS transporter [Maribacter algarum]